jgi:hypothetical protein
MAGPSNALARTTSAISSALPRRTPGRPRRRESQLPASPADVAALAEYETSQLYAGLNDLYSVSGIPETIDSVRDVCSSVTGVQLFIFLLEAYALNQHVLPWTYITDMTFLESLGLPRVAVYFPHFFQILEGGFWFKTMLWSTTSFFIPTLFAYFFNLTIREVKRHGARISVARYTIDPLTFNVIKALTTYIVFVRRVGADWLGPMTVSEVGNAQFGGPQGVLIGSGIVILASLYEAAQRK